MPLDPLGSLLPPATWSAPDDLAIRYRLDVDRALVAMSGDVDMVTAPFLQAALDSLVDEGFTTVVLDLSATTLLDAAGMRVLAAAALGLREAAGELWLHAPSRTVQRVLDIAGLDLPVTASSGKAPAAPADATVDHLSADLVQMGTVMAQHARVDAAMRTLSSLAAATVGGAGGASISLLRFGRIATVAASDDTVARMDHHQYQTGQGPCLTAAADGAQVLVRSLPQEERWPAFIPLARQEGIASILSTPLHRSDHSSGALNIYSTKPRGFDEDAATVAQHLADLGSALIGEVLDEADADVARRITGAMRSRDLIARAQGVLMQRHRLTVDGAAAALHRAARSIPTTVLRLAADILTDATDPDPDLPDDDVPTDGPTPAIPSGPRR